MNLPSVRSQSRHSDAGGHDGLDGIIKRSSPVRSRSNKSRSSSGSRGSPKRSPARRGAHDLESYAEANERIRSNSAAKRERIRQEKEQERILIEEAEKAEEEKLREQREAY